MAKIFKSQVKVLKSKFKFGVEVPMGVKNALQLDKMNGKRDDAKRKRMDTIQKQTKNSNLTISLLRR